VSALIHIIALVTSLGSDRRWLITPALCLFLAGCASSPESIAPAAVALERYRGDSCEQLQAEYRRVSESLADAERLQAESAQSDGAAVGVAAVLFAPAVFAIRGNRAMAGEVSRLKGERAAIAAVQAERHCTQPELR
jgi:hypothetical protein